MVPQNAQVSALFNQGLALHQQGQVAQAKVIFEQVLAQQSKHFDALHELGVIAAQTNNLALAQELIGKAIDIHPNFVDALCNLGVVLHKLKRLDEALASYDRAIALRADFAEALSNRGNVLKELNRLGEALASYDQAIAIKPDYPEAFNNRGTVLHMLKRLDEALASYDKAIELKPIYASSFYNRGNVLKDLKRLDEALASYDQATALKPDYVDAFNNRGNALKGLKRLDEALASYDQAIQIKPDYGAAFNNRGTALHELQRLDEALASYDRAIALNPFDVDAFNNRGNLLFQRQQLHEALASYDRAIALRPDFAQAFNNRGNALKELKRLDEALASYDKAIGLKPDYDEAFNNRGSVLKELKRLTEALASYDQAIALKPDCAEAFNNRGNVLHELRRLDEALASYEKAIELKPDLEFLFGFKQHMQMNLCDWRDVPGQLERLAAAIAAEQKVTGPFPVLALLDQPELQLKASRMYADSRYPASSTLGEFKRREPDGKIRVGYYSADFHHHATSYLIAELFEAHEAHRFALYGFSFGPDKQDEMRHRVSSAFDQFFDVRHQSDQDIAKMSRDLGIDIAVDLKGFTQDSRTGIFAQRCAPIQINFLGYPGTLAAPFFDYIIADKILIPEQSRPYYCEKIVYLPHSYQVNDAKRTIASRVFTRQELGLPEKGFVFCCFNNNYKILPATFEVWMRVLKAVDGSVLWLLEDNPSAAQNLRKEADLRGVNAARLIFAPRMKLDQHLARHRCADLFLDTWPCNAHTTASDALWAGLPVLTLMGQSFAARVAASLLNAVGLPELITETPQAYESLAMALANNPLRLLQIREKLQRKRLTSPLFNGQLFARHLEAAYTEIYRLYQSGEGPERIDVEAMMR